MTPTPTLRAIVTGTPPYRTTQQEVKEVVTGIFPRLAARKTVLDVFDNAQIDSRAISRPLEWYAQERSMAEKNAVYIEEARALALRLAREALERAGKEPGDVDAILYVNTTGLSTPSLDAYLIETLGLNRHAARLPLWGLGCAGGAGGLARAADLVRAGYRCVLLVTVELCSTTFILNDLSKSNFVGTALFADGGAALVITDDAPGQAPALATFQGAFSTLIEDSEDIMGWDVVDGGLKVRFSRDIPTLVNDMMRENVTEALDRNGWQRDDVRHFVVHPGGVKVLEAYRDTLDLPDDALNDSYAVLRQYGNMSSATVLFVLAEKLKSHPHGKALLSAMGPGFSAEHVLLEFPA